MKKQISKAQAQAEFKKISAQKEKLSQEEKKLEAIMNAPDEKSIMDRIKTWDDILKEIKLSKKEFNIMVAGISKAIPKRFSKEAVHMIGGMETMFITAVLNEGWEPDYTPEGGVKQNKYAPWVEVKADKNSRSGFSFSHSYCDYYYSVTLVGVRHIFKNEKLARFAVTQFPEQYNRFFFGK